MYLLSVVGLIACKDANLFEAFSCSWTPSSTFYKLLEIERRWFTHRTHLPRRAIALVSVCPEEYSHFIPPQVLCDQATDLDRPRGAEARQTTARGGGSDAHRQRPTQFVGLSSGLLTVVESQPPRQGRRPESSYCLMSCRLSAGGT